MLVIKTAKSTWFIHDKWLMVGSFTIRDIIIRIIILKSKRYRARKKTNKAFKSSDLKKTTSELIGGDFSLSIDGCVDGNAVYEIEDPSLILTLGKILKIKGDRLPLFVEAPLLILAHLINGEIQNILFH